MRMQKTLLKAFTLIEMLVVIAIIATLAALLFPAVSSMQERGKITQDLNDLRQLGLATQLYLNDNDSTFFLRPVNWMHGSCIQSAFVLESFQIAVRRSRRKRKR